MAGIFGVDIDFNAYTQSFKQYAASTAAYLTEYKQYMTTQATAFANWASAQTATFFAWLRASIQSGMEYAAWAASTAWGYITHVFNGENLKYFLNLIWRGFVAGFNATIDFGYWLARNAKNLFFNVIDLITRIPEFLVRCWNSFVWLLGKGYDIGHWLVTNGFKLIKEVVNILWDGLYEFGKFLWNGLNALCRNIYNFVRNIPTYLSQLYNFLADQFSIILNNLKIFIENAKVVLQHLWSAFTQVVTAVWNVVFEAAKVFLQRTLNAVGISIGVLWGISAGLVELSGTFVNHLSESILGLSLTPLASYAAFGYLQTGLSIALFAFAAYQIARLSYLGIASLFAMTQAPRIIQALRGQGAEPAALTVAPVVDQHFDPQPAPTTDAAPAAILNQFQQSAAAPVAVNDETPSVEAVNRATFG